MCTELVLVDF